MDANAAGGGTVAFNIPLVPGGAFTRSRAPIITLSSALPLAGAGVVIDGTTEPTYAGSPLIEIRGTNIIPFVGSLGCVRIAGTVRGIAVNHCGFADIEGVGAPVITKNYIGLNIDGGFAPPNRYGILLDAGSSGAVIGGGSAGEGNVITATALGVYGNGVSNVLISYNAIGTGPDRTPYVGNQYGIRMIGGSNATVRFNVIGSSIAGIEIGSMSHALIKNNTITQSGAISDAQIGIVLYSGSIDTVIGDVAGGGNTIRGNDTGVLVSGTNNTIRGNSITTYTGSGLAIDLSPGDFQPDGQTPNDLGDSDDGPNHLQNYPIITAVTAAAGVTNIIGSLNSSPNESFALDFYWDNGPCQGSGQARNYLGSLSVTTDESGNAPINTVFPILLPAGSIFTAAATDSAGNTSETAPCALVQALPVPTMSSQALLVLSIVIGAIAMLRLR